MIACGTLGPVKLQLDGAPAPRQLLWRKNLALLVYLARSPRRTRTREHLIGLLWGDKPTDAAAHDLSEAIRMLRFCAGSDAVQTASGQVTLGSGVVQLDVERFEQLCHVEDWAGAAALVAGEFLEGFNVPHASEFEDWLRAERLAWNQRTADALVHHAEALGRSGQLALAAEAAERALALDRRSERAVRAVLRILALDGRRASALGRYADFVRWLAEEMGAKPDQETAALAERIRKQDATRRPPPSAVPAPQGGEGRRAPLVGRSRELELLLETWNAGRIRPHATILLIEGDPGTGRTRLAAEVLARARLEGVAVSTTRAVEADESQAWSGVLALARGGLINAPGVAAAPAGVLGALARLLPEWAERFSGVAGAASTNSLGHTLSDLLHAACDEGPVLLGVDDAHWLDRESLLALEQVLRDLTGCPLGVILTTDEVSRRGELDGIRARLGRDLQGVALHLGPLDGDALRALSQWALPHFSEASLDRVVRRIATDSAGLPLLAVELLHAVALGLDLRASPGAWPEPLKTLDQSLPGDLPDVIVAAIRISFRRLNPPSQRVLATAAALGGRVTSPLLARVTELPEAAVQEALDELEWSRWLVSDPRGYSFVARIVGQVLARDMLTRGQRRRIAHKGGQSLPDD